MYDFIKTIPVTAVISAMAIVAFCFPGLSPVLEFETQLSFINQPIQLTTCHLLHWSSSHLFWDLGMFALLGAICERINRKTFIGLLVSSAILIPISVGIFNPAIETYRGLSGLDTALFGLATLTFIIERIRDRDTAGAIIYVGLLVGMFFKIGHELINGNTFFVESDNFQPVPIAHVVGAIVGLFACVLTTTKIKQQSKDLVTFSR